MSQDDCTETKQKINILRNLNNRFGLIKKADIEKQLQSHEWLTKLIEDQLKLNKTYYTFGENFESCELKYDKIDISEVKYESDGDVSFSYKKQ